MSRAGTLSRVTRNLSGDTGLARICVALTTCGRVCFGGPCQELRNASVVSKVPEHHCPAM
jgi:hypothetical protein